MLSLVFNWTKIKKINILKYLMSFLVLYISQLFCFGKLSFKNFNMIFFMFLKYIILVLSSNLKVNRTLNVANKEMKKKIKMIHFEI